MGLVGGIPYNYTFSWNFDGLGTAAGANPVFNFPATGTYTIALTANDGVSVTTIYKDIFIDPNFGIQVSVLPTKLNDDSGTGIIYVQNVTGGTPPYTFAWTGPDGFMSNDRDIFGLKSGLYTLLVTDANGCQQTEQYFLDVASVLKFEWQSFDVLERDDLVTISWEAPFELEGAEYEIQRSLGDAKNFLPINALEDVASSDVPVSYEVKDASFPVFEEHIYYRVIKRFGQLEFISPIKLVKRNIDLMNSWIAYPNPAKGQPINVTNPRWKTHADSSLKLELFNSGNYFRQVELSNLFQNMVELNTLFGDIPTGILYLRIIQEGKISVIKVINSD